ncbi:FKBP-type peptidyl-prolyl cis-trans isomerase [Mesoterricola sediminis]|uniref:Peptidyl-prolyl cis-trans isomerase n=1 Tax=Mesoterricola sediminis TaxID=2927980 RepID=A0AA48KG24_9BACT|nr:FKBP-type peptidyl-prolyl cis-trans isomerase [Mesoterricola sediminis]BDU77018.1 hypothetical protein METESE_19760 [Mesoterricola sediminis]
MLPSLLLPALTLLAATDRFPIPPAPVLAPPPEAERTDKGLAMVVLKPGQGGARPAPSDMVTLEYAAWSEDGRLIDSTSRRERPLSTTLDQLMKGMGQALRLMTPGEKRRIWIPQPLAFEGAAGRPTGTITMELELLLVEPSPLLAPPDLAAPPEGAVRLPSGVAYRILRPGDMGGRPTSRSTVTVRYSGWTADGSCFDSTWRTGSKPATLRLNEVIPGWTQVLQTMTPGEKVRVWIPEKQAYKGERGMPQGMLVFDIELVVFF